MDIVHSFEKILFLPAEGWNMLQFDFQISKNIGYIYQFC